MKNVPDICLVVKKMTVIAKRELTYTGSFGIGAWLSGLYFIDRKSGKKAGQAMNDAMETFKRKNIKLWVFPEGTRRNTGEIHHFKKGGFHAAIQAQVPIVPVVFSTYKHFLDTREKIFSRGEVTITALPEIPTKGLTANDVDDLIAKTRNAMIEVYQKS
jgi:lysophosphatidate acyltransferase